MRYRMIFCAGALSFLGLMQVMADGTISSISIQPSPLIQSSTSTQGTTGTSAQQSTNSVVLTIETISNTQYQIQGVGDLVRQVWTNLGDTFTAGSNTTTVSFIQSDAFRFFRVVVLKNNESLNQPPAPANAPPSLPPAPPL